MADRGRSLAAALNLPPEAEQFIRGAKQPAVAGSADRAVPVKQTPTIPAKDDASQKPREAKRKERKKSQQPVRQKGSTRARVAITTRFTQATADALRRESLERKLRNEEPWSQQEIIELAVKAYLSGNRNAARQSS